MSGFWAERRVFVTGGHGFLGSHLLASLRAIGAEVRAPARTELDLLDCEATAHAIRQYAPDIVVHLAAVQGGVGYINQSPATLFFENTLINTHLIEAARAAGVRGVLCMGSSCSYPDRHDADLGEDQLWNGPMHPSVAHYGHTKKGMLLQLDACARQSGMHGIVLVPSSLIGPGDDFEEESSHVAGALLRRFIEAQQKGADKVVLWGTGTPVREFMFVGDCVEAILLAGRKALAAQAVPTVRLLNVGTGSGTSIRDLATLIARLTEYEGAIEWDSSRPDGAPRKVLDSSQASAWLEWTPATPLEQGLRLTLQWYLNRDGRI